MFKYFEKMKILYICALLYLSALAASQPIWSMSDLTASSFGKSTVSDKWTWDGDNENVYVSGCKGKSIILGGGEEGPKFNERDLELKLDSLPPHAWVRIRFTAFLINKLDPDEVLEAFVDDEKIYKFQLESGFAWRNPNVIFEKPEAAQTCSIVTGE